MAGGITFICRWRHGLNSGGDARGQRRNQDRWGERPREPVRQQSRPTESETCPLSSGPTLPCDGEQKMDAPVVNQNAISGSEQRRRLLHQPLGGFNVIGRLAVRANQVELVVVIAARFPFPLSLDDGG